MAPLQGEEALRGAYQGGGKDQARVAGGFLK
jgi:hypothetical protein